MIATAQRGQGEIVGKLNTAFNGASAYYNRQTAAASHATSASVGKLATSDRHRELRERGLITHRSTPADIQKVEDRLTAEMRARMMLQGTPEWKRHPYTGVVAAVVVALLLSLPVFGGEQPWLGLLIVVPVTVGAVYYGARIQAQEQERATLIARANWDKKGKCRWCGATEPHIIEGEEEHPRVAHAYELEQRLGPLWVEVPS